MNYDNYVMTLMKQVYSEGLLLQLKDCQEIQKKISSMLRSHEIITAAQEKKIIELMLNCFKLTSKTFTKVEWWCSATTVTALALGFNESGFKIGLKGIFSEEKEKKYSSHVQLSQFKPKQNEVRVHLVPEKSREIILHL